jgi:hypothetical protein
VLSQEERAAGLLFAGFGPFGKALGGVARAAATRLDDVLGSFLRGIRALPGQGLESLRGLRGRGLGLLGDLGAGLRARLGAIGRGGSDVAIGAERVIGEGGTAAARGGRTTLYHYTSEAGQAGILSSGHIRPSLARNNPRDVRYGEGQYLSDIRPGSLTSSQLARRFVGRPYLGRRFTHYLEIDVTGLSVMEGRPGVFVVPNVDPLDLVGRIVSWGRN